MRTRDGLKVLDHASFTEDVEGQIARRRLRLGSHEATVRRLLPAMEAALARNGFAFEHSGLNGNATGQLSVMRRRGVLHRIGVSAAPRWEPAGSPPSLYADSMWCGIDGATGSTFGSLKLTDEVGEDEIDAMLAGAAAGFDVDRATGRR